MQASRWIELVLVGGAVLFGVACSGARPDWAMFALFLLLILPGLVAIWTLRWPPSWGGSSRVVAIVLTGLLASGVLLRPPLTARGLVVASIAVLGFLLGVRLADAGPLWADRWLGWIVLLGLFEGALALQQSFAFAQSVDPTGTFTNRNHLSGFLNLSIAIALGRLGASVGSRSRSRSTRGAASVAWSIATIGAVGVMGLAILRSRSRGGAIVLLCILLLAALLLALRRRRSRRSRSPLVIGAALVVVAGLGAVAGVEGLAHRFERIDENNRPQLYADTLGLIADQPWIGGGAGMYRWQFRPYQTASLELWYTHAHNDYLEVASDWGVPIALLLFVWVGRRTLRVGRLYLAATDRRTERMALGCFGGLASLLLHGTVDFNLHIPANLAVFAIVLGIASTLRSERRSAPQPELTPTGRWWTSGLRLAVILTLVAAGFAVVPRLRSERVLRAADSIEDLQWALELTPDAPEAHFRLGNAYRDSPGIHHLGKSRSHLERAVELNPWAWRYWWELATLEEVSGDAVAAETAFERAIALNPRAGLYRWRWANFLLRRGRTERMLDELRMALEVDRALREPAWSLLQKLELSWAEVARAWPDDAHSRSALLGFAVGARQPVPTASLLEEWEGLLAMPDPPPLKRTAVFVDALVERGDLELARRAWLDLMNKVGRRDDGYTDGRTAVWNGDFERPLSRSGLGWRGRPSEGVVFRIGTGSDPDGGDALHITCEAGVADGAPLARQRSIVEPGATYRLSYRLRVEERCDTSGVAVQVRTVDTRVLLASDEIVGSSPWSDRSSLVDIDPGTPQVELLLRRVRRSQVDTLCRGRVWLDAVRLEPASR